MDEHKALESMIETGEQTRPAIEKMLREIKREQELERTSTYTSGTEYDADFAPAVDPDVPVRVRDADERKYDR